MELAIFVIKKYFLIFRLKDGTLYIIDMYSHGADKEGVFFELTVEFYSLFKYEYYLKGG